MSMIRQPSHRHLLRLEVLGTEQLTPNFRLITLGGTDLDRFEHLGLDQFFRFFFPRAGQRELRMPTLANNAWYAQYRLMPASRRPWARNYTVRRFRPDQREIDVEFVTHGDEGPASAWALAADKGAPVGMFTEGVCYQPPGGTDVADWQLLVGDESAVPAILSIVEQSPADLRADVYLEVPASGDVRDVTAPPDVTVTWLPRDADSHAAHAVPGQLALTIVRNRAALPGGRGYAYLAGEQALVTGLRRHLVTDRGMPKSDVRFVGYWRHGAQAMP